MADSAQRWHKTHRAMRIRRTRFVGLEPEFLRQVLFLDRFASNLAGAAAVFLTLGGLGLVLLGSTEDPIDSQELSVTVACIALGLSAAIGGLNLYAQRLAAMRELSKYWDAHPTPTQASGT